MSTSSARPHSDVAVTLRVNDDGSASVVGFEHVPNAQHPTAGDALRELYMRDYAPVRDLDRRMYMTKASDFLRDLQRQIYEETVRNCIRQHLVEIIDPRRANRIVDAETLAEVRSGADAAEKKYIALGGEPLHEKVLQFENDEKQKGTRRRDITMAIAKRVGVTRRAVNMALTYARNRQNS